MKQTRKSREIRVYCTEETYNNIKEKSEQANMKMSSYLKWLGLNSNIVIKEE